MVLHFAKVHAIFDVLVEPIADPRYLAIQAQQHADGRDEQTPVDVL
jgi:hypothetical protein